MWVSDPNVKVCAERAAWLRNDEAHYERRFTDRDVNDLKTLIRLTVNWIDSALQTRAFTANMQPRK